MSGGDWKELFFAACDGDLDLVRYHTRNGVDLDYAHPEFFGTPLVACILAKQEEIALFLLESGADPHLLSEFDGVTPLQAVRRAGLPAVERRLISLGAVEPVAKKALGLDRMWRILFSGRRAA